MVHIASLEEIIRDMDEASLSANVHDIQEVLQREDEESIVVGHLLNACHHFKNGDNDSALSSLLDVRHVLPLLPLPIISNIIWLCRRMGNFDRAAHECLDFAQDAIKYGYTDLGLEACTGAFILEANGSLSLSNDPSMCLKFSSLYHYCSSKLQKKIKKLANYQPNTYPLKVALVIPHLVDDVVAYCQRVLYFARYIDRTRYDLNIYISENLSGRNTPLFPMGCVHCSSYIRGQNAVHELRELDVPIWVCSTSSSFCDSAIQLSQWLTKDRIDIAIFQSSLSTPIDWMAAHLSQVGLKASLHTGCSLFMPGMDITIYDNKANIEREEAFWPPDAGVRHFLYKGTDISELLNQPKLDRRPLGIPDHAVVLGTLSNHLSQRLSPSYMDFIIEVLKECNEAWFIAFGSDVLTDKMNYFKERGVADRVRFGGKQVKSGSALKCLDLYVNEFPIGGSQSIIEAMACCVPVVAMHWGKSHTECIGAELVGKEYAIGRRDEAACLSLTKSWIANPQERLKVAYKLQQRAFKYFSADNYVRMFMECLEDQYRKKYDLKSKKEGVPPSVSVSSMSQMGLPLGLGRPPGLAE